MVIVDVIVFTGPRITMVLGVKYMEEQFFQVITMLERVQIQHFIRKTSRYLPDLENILELQSMLRGAEVAVLTTLRVDRSELVTERGDLRCQTQTAVGVVEDSMVMVDGKIGIWVSGLLCREMGVLRDLI
jgi:hypothetical protein